MQVQSVSGTVVGLSSQEKTSLGMPALSAANLRKAAFLTRTTRTKQQIAKDARKKPRPRLSVVLPDQYNSKEDLARQERENVTRKSVMISEISVRTVAFLQALLCAEKENPGSLPKIKGEQFGHRDFKALCNKLGDMLASPVDKYLVDLSIYLASEMAKGGLQVAMHVGSPIQITQANEFAVKDWLYAKIDEFHEPYRV